MPKVRVVNPDGVSGTIDSAQLPDALNEGFKVAPEPQAPSAGVNFLQNLTGATTGARSNQDVIQGATQGLPFMVKHPLDAGKMLLQSLAAAQQGTQQRALAQMKQPGLENKAAGAVRGIYGLIPGLGPMMEGAANQFDKGDLSGGLGTSTGLAAILASAHPAAPEAAASVLDTIKTAGKTAAQLPADIKLAAKGIVDPNTVYHSYLDPMKQVKAEMPDLTPRVQKALINKVQINNPDVAARMASGGTTLADLEVARQVSGTAARSAYTATGRPTELALGFEKANSAIRDVLYPKIEELHGLPEGAIQKLKLSEGSLINTKPIIPASQNPVQALLNLTRWPGLAARAGGKAATYGYQYAKTGITKSNLPTPQQP